MSIFKKDNKISGMLGIFGRKDKEKVSKKEKQEILSKTLKTKQEEK